MTEDDRTPAGVRCPDCGCAHLFVIYTRPRKYGILRCRECRHCGRRIITHERSVGAPREPDSPA